MELSELEEVLRARREAAPAGSYSATLLADPEKAARQIVAEAFEFGLELTRPEPDADRVASEAADVVFHTLAGLVGAGVPLQAVLDELAGRRGASPHAGGSGGAGGARPAGDAASDAAVPDAAVPDAAETEAAETEAAETDAADTEART